MKVFHRNCTTSYLTYFIWPYITYSHYTRYFCIHVSIFKLHCPVLYTILYSTLLHCISRYIIYHCILCIMIVTFHLVLYCVALCCTALYVLYCTVLYCVYCTVWYNIVQSSLVPCMMLHFVVVSFNLLSSWPFPRLSPAEEGRRAGKATCERPWLWKTALSVFSRSAWYKNPATMML